MSLYVVVAFRCGGVSNVFPIGAFSSQELAMAAAADHRTQRGGKYDHRVYEFYADIMNDDVGHAGNAAWCVEWTENCRPQEKPVVDDESRQLLAQACQAMSRRIAELELQLDCRKSWRTSVARTTGHDCRNISARQAKK